MAYNKKWYDKNKDRLKESQNSRRKEFNNRLRDMKQSLGCSICGNNDHRVIHFHHTNSNKKEYGISELVGRSSWERLMSEIDKCIPVCANCHAIIHYAEKEDT